MKLTYRSGSSGRSLTITDGQNITRIDLSSYDYNKLSDYMKRVFSWRNSGMIGYPPVP